MVSVIASRPYTKVLAHELIWANKSTKKIALRQSIRRQYGRPRQVILAPGRRLTTVLNKSKYHGWKQV